MDATEKKASRTVHFSEDESSLVTATYGPEDPWFTDEAISAEFLSTKYAESCIKHGVQRIPKVLNQLKEFNYELRDQDRIPVFDLSGTELEYMDCEALEEIFKRIRFHVLDLENTRISEEGAVAMFEMIEYYEACETVNISRNAKILGRGWQACSRMIKKTQCLKELIAKETCLKEEFIPFLTRSLKIGTHLAVLNLERCHLQGKPIIMLTNALRMNRSLQEIYLGENHLESTDAYNISNLLSYNTSLQLLDLSNNIIGDKGAQHLCQRLSGHVYAPHQPDSPSSPGDDKTGLRVLVMWNNCLTNSSGLHFCKLLEANNDMEILNVGHNDLTDSWLQGLREPLKNNSGLSRLGLQSTKITCAAAKDLALVFEHNKTLHRVDLRDNQLKVDGLQSMLESLKMNESMTQLDLDQNPTYLESEDLAQYQAALHSINEQLKLNLEKCPPNSYSTRLPLNVGLNSRKISLTCEIKIPQTVPKKTLSCGRLRSPAPSPTPSPIMSPIPSPGKSRFSVSKVADPSPVVPEVRSRFSITPVTDIPKIVLPEESKVTVGFQVTPNAATSNIPEAYKIDCEQVDTNSNQNSTCEHIDNENNKNNNNNDSVECDDEVEQITSKMEQEDLDERQEELTEPIILEVKQKEDENFDIITEMNPAYLDSVSRDSTSINRNEKPQLSISQTFPPRISEPRKLSENAHNYSNTDNTQITKSESKSTLQSLFALFQTPSLSFSSTASAFYAKTEAKMSQIVPSLSSISLSYEPFKFSSKHEKPKMHLSGDFLSSNERHLDSSALSAPLLDSTNYENLPASASDKENTLDVSPGKKKKSKKKSKEEPFWDFGDDSSESAPSTSDVVT